MTPVRQYSDSKGEQHVGLFKSLRIRLVALGAAGLVVAAMAAPSTATVATAAIRPSV
jgi:hypothetical protein